MMGGTMLGQGRYVQAEDPKKAVVGYIAAPAAAGWATINLLDYGGQAFVPSAQNPFAIKDVIVRNTGAVAGSVQIRVGGATPQVIKDIDVPNNSTVKVSLAGAIPFWDVLQVNPTVATLNITVDGVQN